MHRPTSCNAISRAMPGFTAQRACWADRPYAGWRGADRDHRWPAKILSTASFTVGAETVGAGRGSVAGADVIQAVSRPTASPPATSVSRLSPTIHPSSGHSRRRASSWKMLGSGLRSPNSEEMTHPSTRSESPVLRILPSWLSTMPLVTIPSRHPAFRSALSADRSVSEHRTRSGM